MRHLPSSPVLFCHLPPSSAISIVSSAIFSAFSPQQDGTGGPCNRCSQSLTPHREQDNATRTQSLSLLTLTPTRLHRVSGGVPRLRKGIPSAHTRIRHQDLCSMFMLQLLLASQHTDFKTILTLLCFLFFCALLQNSLSYDSSSYKFSCELYTCPFCHLI